MQYFKLPSGVRDILPDESEKLDAAEETLRKKFSAAGFRSVRTAGLEYYDTFANIKSSIEQTKMFKMTDKDGSLIVLRPDMTLACARIAATKLQEEDHLVSVKVINENQNVVLQTRNGYFLRFPSSEVPVKKKAAVGVRGIRLQKKDELENVWLFEEGTETKVQFGEKEVTLNRLKSAKRDGTGTKNR